MPVETVSHRDACSISCRNALLVCSVLAWGQGRKCCDVETLVYEIMAMGTLTSAADNGG
jgi:hypothetical protein